jgi:hypothetical protein
MPDNHRDAWKWNANGMTNLPNHDLSWSEHRSVALESRRQFTAGPHYATMASTEKVTITDDIDASGGAETASSASTAPPTR